MFFNSLSPWISNLELSIISIQVYKKFLIKNVKIPLISVIIKFNILLKEYEKNHIKLNTLFLDKSKRLTKKSSIL